MTPSIGTRALVSMAWMATVVSEQARCIGW